MSDDDQPEDRTMLANGDHSAPSLPRAPRRVAPLEPGDILNGIYRVDRYIARGGMGDVYEGRNLESDERVAIKVLRSHHADDPRVLAMFRKEARTLTQFAHPAVVHYRVIAREPQLDLLYIVTDFIDGEPLSARLDGRRPPVAEIVALARRLASGLEVAHEHGAVHRDMSPDNVLLPKGQLDRAKIIDFGIAKSLDVTAETMVGDGFAGKLGYVAPEQFGDYDRKIGPWTDVYSTALVILAFVRGKAPDMGKTLSEAVERRGSGPDLNDLPPEIEPLLRRMLVADPNARLQSMTEVIAELDRIDLSGNARGEAAASLAPSQPPVARPAKSAPTPKAKVAGASSSRPGSRWRRRLPLVLSALVLLVACAAALALWLRAGDLSSHGPADASRGASLAATARPAAFAGASALLDQTPCSWLSIDAASTNALRLMGGAGDPGRVAADLTAAAQTRGMAIGPVDSRAVQWFPPALCPLVETLRSFDQRNDASLSIGASAVGDVPGQPACPGGPATRLLFTLLPRDPTRDFALLSIQPKGKIGVLVGGRAKFQELAAQHPDMFRQIGDQRFEIASCFSGQGPLGLILIDGRGPIDLSSLATQPIEPKSISSLSAAAKAGDWHSRSAWLYVGRPSGTPAPLRAFVPGVRPVVGGRVPDARPAEAPAVAAEPASGAVAACRLYDGKHWQELGYTSREQCIVRAFADRCSVVNALFGQSPLRRYNGHIEMQRGYEWSSVARSRCR